MPAARALAHELASLTPALQQAAVPAASNSSFLDRLESNAQRLVRITPVDAPPGDDPASVVTRIGVDAAHADIAAALADIAKLPDAAKPLAAAWVEKAQARNAAIAASRKLAADALAALSKPNAAMTRVVFFLILVGVLALGAAWLADRPGDVVVTWQGLRIETSLMVIAAALLVAVAVLMTVWSIVRAIVRSPAVLAKRQRERRGARAYAAISDGLIAVGSGDIDAARKLSADANRLAPGEPLTLLLSAQAAQLSGDRDGAERAFRAMAGRADTKALGLHGLFIEAHRRDDHESARAHAEEAAATTPTLGWAGRAVLEARCKEGDWSSALALLERHRGALDKASYRRQRAVLLTARALATEDSDRDAAKNDALEAVKLAPTLVPAVALAARLLAAGRLLAQGQPHHRHRLARQSASRIGAKFCRAARRANPRAIA